MMTQSVLFFFFFFNDTATTEIYTLSLHDALPIFERLAGDRNRIGDAPSDHDDRVRLQRLRTELLFDRALDLRRDRKSTRLNSSHSQISYAVFCLKKKNNIRTTLTSYNTLIFRPHL